MIAQTYDVKAGLASVDVFSVVGVSVVTTNADDRAAADINALWEVFFRDSVGQKINNKVDDVIYAVYSDYEGDHEAPYRLTIGYRVHDSVGQDPAFHHVEVQGGEYAVLSAAGDQPKALIEGWEAIWSGDLPRTFNTDFEVYGPRFFEDGVHEVLIHVGVETTI